MCFEITRTIAPTTGTRLKAYKVVARVPESSPACWNPLPIPGQYRSLIMGNRYQLGRPTTACGKIIRKIGLNSGAGIYVYLLSSKTAQDIADANVQHSHHKALIEVRVSKRNFIACGRDVLSHYNVRVATYKQVTPIREVEGRA